MSVKISIIVPCYNHAQYLDECLESVLAQTFQDWECIIVNDGSTDNTEEVSRDWLEKDNRFKYIFQRNAGLSATRNKGIENAIGEFILPLDADDKISSEYCRLAMIEFEKDENLKVVYCQAEKFGLETGLWKLPDFNLFHIATCNLIFCSAIFKKLDCIEVGGFDKELIYGWEDWDFWISMLKNGEKVIRLKEIGFFYRIKSNSMLKNMSKEHFDFSNNYILVKHKNFFIKNYNILRINNHKTNSKKFAIHLLFKNFLQINLFNFD